MELSGNTEGIPRLCPFRSSLLRKVAASIGAAMPATTSPAAGLCFAGFLACGAARSSIAVLTASKAVRILFTGHYAGCAIWIAKAKTLA